MIEIPKLGYTHFGQQLGRNFLFADSTKCLRKFNFNSCSSHERSSLIRLPAIVDSDYNHCSRCIEVEKHAPLPNAEPEFPFTALELLHVSMPGFGKSFKSGSDALCVRRSSWSKSRSAAGRN